MKPLCHACHAAPAGNFTDDKGWHLCADCARDGLKTNSGLVASNVQGVDRDGKIPEGAEPWEWRPFRPMRQEDGSVIVDQPPPPIHVSNSPPRAWTGKGLPAGLARSSETQELEQRLAVLTPEQRAPLKLQLEGNDYQEIAAKLELPVTTVRERLRRARAALRRPA